MATYSAIINDQGLAADPFEKTARLLELAGDLTLAQEMRELGRDLRGVAEGRVSVEQVDHERIYALADAVSVALDAICVPDPGPIVFWLENIPSALDELGASSRSADDRRLFQRNATDAPLDDLRPRVPDIDPKDLDAHSRGL